MMSFFDDRKKLLKAFFVLLTAGMSITVSAAPTETKLVVEVNSNLGIIKGVVRDSGGSPIADATVAIFRAGTSTLLKQVNSANDGSFLAKILPGTYTVMAVAQGFNAFTLAAVEVGKADEFVYGFKLERSGSGNTLPEKRADRNSTKWRIRAANAQRSIYQNNEGKAPIDETADDSADVAAVEEDTATRRGQAVIESYFASSAAGNYSGVNFATVLPGSERAQVILAGQTGIGKTAPQRLEGSLKFRANDSHQIRLNTSAARLGTIKHGNENTLLGQFSVQGLDEWKVREGVILVFGLDYSKFLGAGSDFSISPRLGLQFDVDAKTRFRAAYTTKTEEKSWANAIEMEDTQVVFSEPVAVEDLVVTHGRPRMNKSRRLEFGIERVLDNKSSIEADAFLDTTLGRGVGFTSIPLDTLAGNGFGDFVSNQQGSSQGLRIVYTRRLNGHYTASTGYSFGKGQKISQKAISSPANMFENDLFQSFFGQFEADLRTGTNVKAVFRLSPQATVFAIDPFQGRLAIYDPSLNVMVTQSLPTLGLPIHAEAIVDARNLFGFQTGINGEEGTLRLNSQGRSLRGGILVRF